jgi:hypothetical protein
MVWSFIHTVLVHIQGNYHPVILEIRMGPSRGGEGGGDQRSHRIEFPDWSR